MSKIQGRPIARSALFTTFARVSEGQPAYRNFRGENQCADQKRRRGITLVSKNKLSIACAMLFCGLASAAIAQDKPATPVKIGVLGDMSGVYQALSGKGAVAAVELAVEDMGGKVLGRPIEIVSADHQNKTDIGSTIARRWYDQEGVSAIVDVVGSGVSLAVSAVANERKKVFLASNGATSALNMAQCNPYTVQWRSDTFAAAKAITEATMKTGAKTWYVIGADYNLGHALEREMTQIVNSSGGKMLGSVFHPLGTSDFASYILSAQNSGAQIVALANAGDDMVNALKTADEFGLLNSAKIVSGLVFITDIHALGLKTTKGLVLSTDFYWDMDDKTRAWADRYYKKMGSMPNLSHAADYSATLQYLKAMEAAKSDKADDVMAMMHKMPLDDMYARHAVLREDNLMMHDMLLAQVKTPEESKRPWDYYKILDVVPGEKAFRPLNESKCPMVKK
jgi:branched-chain amino acid transport system substrate-binding protein